MVGSTRCKTAPMMLNTSPSSQTTMKTTDSPSAEPRRKFSMICGEKTTTQQAIEMEPVMPLTASMSRLKPCEGGNMAGVWQPRKRECRWTSDDACDPKSLIRGSYRTGQVVFKPGGRAVWKRSGSWARRVMVETGQRLRKAAWSLAAEFCRSGVGITAIEPPPCRHRLRIP